MKKYVCSICGYVYDESKGIPEAGIALGTKWEDLPDNWSCPLCGAPKSAFKAAEEKEKTETASPTVTDSPESHSKEHYSEESHSDMREMTFAELSAVCSNLAKGCEKQYLSEESDLFTELAEYYSEKAEPTILEPVGGLLERINYDLNNHFMEANKAAQEASDRGAKRVLTWSEKVTRIMESLLKRYEEEGTAILDGTKIWVCEVCGFIYLGETPPDICPICKVPNLKIMEVKSV